jgi:hypothetical protein
MSVSLRESLWENNSSLQAFDAIEVYTRSLGYTPAKL